MRHTQVSMRRKAFTLVELLVVIAVIAVLIAILMPALRKARMSAYQVSCAGNLRQIMLGINAYANQFDGWMPYNPSAPGNPEYVQYDFYGPTDTFSWAYLMSSSVGLPYNQTQAKSSIWICPLAYVDGFAPESTDTVNNYSINCNVASHYYSVSGVNIWAGVRLSKLNSTMLTVSDGALRNNGPNSSIPTGPWSMRLEFDSSTFNTTIRGTFDFAAWPLNISTEPKPGIVTHYHNGSFNAAFGDGHVESMTSYAQFKAAGNFTP
jgi:prepilin-type N-terminal cleavage/methylation domain-containing protein/prepilin-type processing-associated H-X9-DG protein